MTGWRALLRPHRLVMGALAAGVVGRCAVALRRDWIVEYYGLALEGLWRTIRILALTTVLGFLLAIPLRFAQAAGSWYLARPASAFCTIIRGTPLLLQIWLLHYGLGSLSPQYPAVGSSDLGPYMRQAWPYEVLALTLSYAGCEGEVMRGAFRNVAKGQLESARAFGMRPGRIFRRIWLPQAIRGVLPTLGGKTILQLKAAPLVATMTIVDIHAVAGRVRQDTFIVYEPLLLLAVVCLMIAGCIAFAFRLLERSGVGGSEPRSTPGLFVSCFGNGSSPRPVGGVGPQYTRRARASRGRARTAIGPPRRSSVRSH